MRLSTRNVELASVALCKFNLARRGVEFTDTHHNSPHGDLWVKTPDGLRSVEIKGTFDGVGWLIKPRQ